MINNIKYSVPVIFLGSIFMLCLAIALLADMPVLLSVPFGLLVFYSGWNNSRLLLYGLLFLLPWSVEYSFTASLGMDLPDEPMMILLSFLVVAAMVYQSKNYRQEILNHPLSWMIFVHLSWILFTTILSADIFISVKYLLAKSWYIAAFYLATAWLLCRKEHIKYAGIIFIVSISLVTVVIFIRHATTGFLFEKINESVFPFFRNHVNYAAMLVCAIPVLACMRQLVNTRRQRRMISFLFIFISIALIFSYSRGAWLAYIAGLATPFLIRKKILVPAYSLVLLLVIIAFFYLKANDRYTLYAPDFNKTIFHTNFKEHLWATYKGQDVSTAERFYRWTAGVRMVEEKPVTGFGPAVFSRQYHGYAVPLFRTWVSENKEASTVHNYYLLTAAEQGLPGVCIFVLLTAVMLFFVQKLYHRAKDIFYRQVLLAVGSIYVMVLVVNFLSDLVETDKVGSLFFVCMGIVVSIHNQVKKSA